MSAADDHLANHKSLQGRSDAWSPKSKEATSGPEIDPRSVAAQKTALKKGPGSVAAQKTALKKGPKG